MKTEGYATRPDDLQNEEILERKYIRQDLLEKDRLDRQRITY
jgi:hypothetical protein